MSIGAPDKSRSQRPASAKRPFPIVLALAFIVLLPLDIPAVRALDQSWVMSIAGGAGAAFAGAMFAFAFFGGNDRSTLRFYGWKRAILLAVASAVFTPIVYFVFALPLLTTLATGLFVALFAMMLLMLGTGDL